MHVAFTIALSSAAESLPHRNFIMSIYILIGCICRSLLLHFYATSLVRHINFVLCQRNGVATVEKGEKVNAESVATMLCLTCIEIDVLHWRINESTRKYWINIQKSQMNRVYMAAEKCPCLSIHPSIDSIIKEWNWFKFSIQHSISTNQLYSDC